MNLLVYSRELRLIAIGVAVTWIAFIIAQIVYLSRTRERPLPNQNQRTITRLDYPIKLQDALFFHSS
jgi:hypothetical protein